MKIAKKRSVKETPEERFMQDVYGKMDIAVRAEIARLQSEECIIMSCRDKCSACCRQPINTLLPEVHAIAQYIKRTFTFEQKEALKKRTEEWFDWIRNDFRKLLAQGMDETEAFYEHGPGCPLLEEKSCSVYPVRPTSCRLHYVASDPRNCLPDSDPEALRANLEPIFFAALPDVQAQADRVKKLIQQKGMTTDELTMLLPQWLRFQMDWTSI